MSERRGRSGRVDSQQVAASCAYAAPRTNKAPACADATPTVNQPLRRSESTAAEEASVGSDIRRFVGARSQDAFHSLSNSERGTRNAGSS